MRFLLIALVCFTFSGTSIATDISISDQQAMLIGKKIFQNECAGKTACLTSWNQGEDFPSLGIGHFIWYPKNSNGPFKESFPALVQFMQTRGVQVPSWLSLAIKTGAPWPSRDLFLAAQNSQKMRQLRKLLSETKSIQTSFMIQRLNQALSRMFASTPVSEHVAIQQQFDRIASARMGYYALIDYVNFKGEGTSSSERYQGKGWGLLQVLQGMKNADSESGTLISFATAAKAVLSQRVQHAPPDRHEKRWLAGWKKRINTYTATYD